MKLTQDEYRGYIVKYLVSEGLKCYKIPLPSIISKKLGKHNTDEHNSKRLNECHFISNIPGVEGRKRKKPLRTCFICSQIPGIDMKPKITSFWCEDCKKLLCFMPCFKIYHTEKDYKKYGKF